MHRSALAARPLRQAGAVLVALALLALPCEFGSRLADAEASALHARTVLRGTIARGDTLASALRGALSGPELQRVVAAARPLHDLARVATGRAWGLAFRADGLLAFTYAIDDRRTLRVEGHDAELSARIVTRDYEHTPVAVRGRIETSLFAAVASAGERDALATDLADVFAWDVDFNTELRRGDTFRVVVDRLSVEGGFVRYGPVQAAELQRGSRTLRAVRFDRGGRAGYYTPEGVPLRKAFLRSPLRFSRISSGFTARRLHPILKVARPHLGIDYAAPSGTPVHAAADGVVVLAGWQGGFGKTVRLRHRNGFETLYGHLSRIDVRPGARVGQGERLGAVGSTGLSTAPHLDYRMIRDGAHVNPLTVHLPPAEPIAPAQRAAFAREAARVLGLLPGAPGA